MSYNNRYHNNIDGEAIGGVIIIATLIILVVGLCVVAANSPHHARHYKHTVEKLKGGRYAYKDHKGQWWIYQLKAVGKALADVDVPDIDFPQPWTTSTGSVRLPMGGTWVKGVQPEPEEIEGELEAAIEETAEGPEADTADSMGDADSAGDGSDAGDAGGGDGGDGGGGDGGGGGGGGE
jgi:uncharacterized membrane protein YgcG